MESGANINQQGDILNRDPLMNAAKMHAYSSAEFLLIVGADPTLTDVDGKTALDIAKEKNDARMIKILEQKGGAR